MTTEDRTRPEPERGGRGLDRWAWLVLLLLLGGLPWLVHPWFDPSNDGAMYVLTGRELVDGHGYSMLGQPFRIRPPGFSLLIAPLLAWQRAQPFLVLNAFVGLTGVAACWLFFLWARERLGAWVAAVLALVVFLNPGFRQLSNQPMSDVLGLGLLFACLLLERRAARAPGWRRELVLGLAIGVSALVRSQIVLLAPAVVAMRLVRRLFPGRRDAAAEVSAGEPWGAWAARALLLVGVVTATQLPWHLRNAGVDPITPADQTRLWSYGTAMWHADMGDPASRRLEVSEVLARLPQRGGQLLGVLEARLPGPLPRYRDPERVPWFAFSVYAAVLWVGFKRRSPAELFMAGSSLLVALYFAFAPRLVLPLYALGLAALAETAADLLGWALRRPLGGRRARHAARACCILAGLGLLWVDAAPRPGWSGIEMEHRRLEAVTEAFEAALPADAVLASNRPWHYAVFLDRYVYALEFVIRRSNDPADVEALIDRYGIDHVILSPTTDKDREVLPYFDARYGPQADPLARVYRVR